MCEKNASFENFAQIRRMLYCGPGRGPIRTQHCSIKIRPRMLVADWPAVEHHLQSFFRSKQSGQTLSEIYVTFPKLPFKPSQLSTSKQSCLDAARERQPRSRCPRAPRPAFSSLWVVLPATSRRARWDFRHLGISLLRHFCAMVIRPVKWFHLVLNQACENFWSRRLV